MTDYVPKTFNIIKHHGTPNDAVLDNGRKVHRKEQIFIPEYGKFVMCAPYDNHFVFEVPPSYKGQPSFQCTCGSPAVIVGASAYSHDGSPTGDGMLLVCLMHATYQQHATGERRWV